MTDSDPEYVCRKCREPVQYGARKCPHCGHNAAARGQFSRITANFYGPAKWICYLSIVGIPIGLYYRRKQKKHRKQHERGVAVAPS